MMSKGGLRVEKRRERHHQRDKDGDHDREFDGNGEESGVSVVDTCIWKGV